MVFSVVNENQSCYASLKLQASRLHRQLSPEIDPTSSVFTQSYLQPLKPLLFHLQRLSSDLVLMEFTVVSVHFGSVPCAGIQGSWRSLLGPVPIENPIYPPIDSFPIFISGFSYHNFDALVDGVSSSGLLSKSTLILSVSRSPPTLKLVLPGKNQAEIELGSFNFTSFCCSEAAEGSSIVVSLREFSALMSLAAHLNAIIDFYFGPSGQ